MITKSVLHLYELLQASKPIEAMELYYHDDVTMQENDDQPRIGKEFCLKYEKGLMSSVKNFTAKVLSQAINEENQTVFTEMRITFERNELVHILDEVSVQKWKDGKVIAEKFYYKTIKINEN